MKAKKIWRYGDDVDTDVIIPARYLAIADWNELAEHAMEDIDTTFAPNVKAGEHGSWQKTFGLLVPPVNTHQALSKRKACLLS